MSSVENQVVSRKDADSNATESIRYFGSGADKMMGSLHQPQGSIHAGLVVCSPILADFYTRYRHEVILGRDLAARGTAVFRFQYRGTGNSDGDEALTTFDSMVADALEAAAALRDLTGVRDVTFLGTRFGALIAAAAAEADGARTLVLWEPVLEATTYFREANRARLVQTASRGEGQGSTFEELLAQLERGEVADILGYSLYRALYDSSSVRTLDGELGDDPRSILIMQLGNRPELRKTFVALADRLRGRGHDVDTRTVSLGEPWWMNAEGWTAVESRPQAQELIASTTAWIAERSTARESA
jgi:pimeloyl-ACP methyl ester carboxylesterase